ncbi:Kynurenine 3-monooxygenase [Neolecta irregularis DAH-3]|uniref:Kynurenine 3-monooxygenase n=1 Tax=Neolecta irregularis (strain DAH-3) TaxID=1198029 RepID=A0A1U7LQU9_NEOID|nr:Kynurenine 3-monooxygenase [Neolecta irregularis DAH-3]|eukprot:OLL25035.1 Kynurenine 3-monooxygenase [Neolecta irregularis DAH-3]
MDSAVKISTVAIVGGGPVGALAAIYFAKEGWKVSLYELREDPRMEETVARQSKLPSKSINLALSERGIHGLRGASPHLVEEILAQAIPMGARMIHDTAGNQTSQFYDIHGKVFNAWAALGLYTAQHINSVDRDWLNTKLLIEAKKYPNVDLYFEHKLQYCDLRKNELVFLTRGAEAHVTAHLIVGADGAHSQVRQSLMKVITQVMDFEQQYIDSHWLELTISPWTASDGERDFKMEPHRLHIWPRQTFMLIALPNSDKSFTCTLFMPKSMFDNLQSNEALLEFFKRFFPDTIQLIGKDELIRDFFRNPRSPLLSIKCFPYILEDKCVILGDASHAMVPFYGQGMNCGFEDVRLLFENIKTKRLKIALYDYQNSRKVDLNAICDLAMQNFVEMRAGVTRRSYLLRKKIEEFLYARVPSLGVVPLYTMVSFSNKPYSEAKKKSERQGRLLTTAAYGGLLITGLGVFYAGALLARRTAWAHV